jgi:cysteinyl-tRNA synthetase
MALTLYNTLTRRKEAFEPLEPGKVRMYVCGVTVYDYSHIGHARVYVAFDVVYRYLKQRGYDVTYVRNFTDVDDKIIKRAGETGEDPLALASRFSEEFHADMGALGCLGPDVEPRVSTHIPEIVRLIEQIIGRGHAYVVDGDVYFEIDSFGEYGKLSGRTLEEQRAGERVAVDERKKNPFDFALWKSAKPGEISWPSPWGPGRPGWHIECSAMSSTHLGNTLDIHAGGKDLVFPHHENEIAQSECASGQPFVRYWLHNGFVNVDSEKMSKSLGNFFRIRDVIAIYHPMAVRWFLLSTQYRAPINYTEKHLEEASARVYYLYQTLHELEAALAGGASIDDGPLEQPEILSRLREAYRTAMDDDFNTPLVMGALSEPLALANELLHAKKARPGRLATLAALREVLQEPLQVVGIGTGEVVRALDEMRAHHLARRGLDEARIQELVAARSAARGAKNWAEADRIRDELLASRVQLMDGPSGTRWRPVYEVEGEALAGGV